MSGRNHGHRVIAPLRRHAGRRFRRSRHGEADLDRYAAAIAHDPAFLDTTIDGARRIGCIDPNGLAVRLQVSRKHAVQVDCGAMTVVKCVLARTTAGITDASTTRRPVTPITRQSGSTTARGSSTAPMCSVLIGYGARAAPLHSRLLLILPLFVALAFALIVDIDAPRLGFVKVVPQNLLALQESLK